LSLALDAVGRRADAEAALRRAVELNPRAVQFKEQFLPEETSPTATEEGQRMGAGLDALYQRNDPEAATAQFRKVLELNPRHYGATFQLARALDRAGRPGEARPYWEKMARMAEAEHDKETLEIVRARLREP